MTTVPVSRLPRGETPTPEFDSQAMREVYGRWAPIYDLVFGAVFKRGRQAASAAAGAAGGRVLEVGVGTGISLPLYPNTCHVFGVDLSEPMLEKARQRVAREGLRHVEGLSVMDAERLEFPDGSFDRVVAQYVVSSVPHPERALEEFARVLRPGGEIVLLNRVGADAGPRRVFERLFQPVATRLGWRSEFPWERFEAWLGNSRHDVRLLERRPMPPFGHFSLIRFGKAAATGTSGADHPANAHPRPGDGMVPVAPSPQPN